MQRMLLVGACLACVAFGWRVQINPTVNRLSQPKVHSVSRHSPMVMEEKRFEDGQAFTLEEFKAYYDALGEDFQAKWDSAEVAPEDWVNPPPLRELEEFKLGEEVTATTLRVVDFGVFCDIGATQDALLHISEAADTFVEDIYQLYEENQEIKVRIKEINAERGRIGLTVKSGEIKPKMPLSQLPIGEELEAKVRSVRDFGLFVDVGCEKDGLLHISQVSDDFVDDIYSMFQPGDDIKVTVQSVDIEQGRISLTRRTGGGGGGGRAMNPDAKPLDAFQEGEEVEGTVRSIAGFGVFMDIGATTDGFLHISEAADDYVDDLYSLFTVGDTVKCKIKEIDPERQRIGLTRKEGGGGGDDYEGGGGYGGGGGYDDAY